MMLQRIIKGKFSASVSYMMCMTAPYVEISTLAKTEKKDFIKNIGETNLQFSEISHVHLNTTQKISKAFRYLLNQSLSRL